MSGEQCTANLSRAERQALRPGAVVAYQSERMLDEIVGTVEAVNKTTGAVVLCDGTWVLSPYRLRLVSAKPMEISVPDVRGLAAGDDKDASGGPSDAAGRMAAAFGARQQKPVLDGQETARACQECGAALETDLTAGARFCRACRHKRQSTRNGVRRADRQAWLAAVRAVRERMASGETKAQAIAAAAPTCGVGLNPATYGWWRRKLCEEGLLEKGRKATPRKRLEAPHSQRSGAPQAPCPECADARAQLAAAPAQYDEESDRLARLQKAYEAEREQVAELSKSLRQEREARCAREARAGEVAAECGDRLRLVTTGAAVLRDLQREAQELSQAVEVVRRYPWALRQLRRTAEANREAQAQAQTGGEA